MKLIVGLGNPGRKYELTRHNAGFMLLERLALKLGCSFERRKFDGLYAEGSLPSDCDGPARGDGKVVLLKPQTYMNRSGESVGAFMSYFKLVPDDLLVAVDDVALPLGALRIRKRGSAGGHNGLKDIERRMGSDAYARIRLGVGGRDTANSNAPAELSEHVLGRLTAQEQERLEQTFERAVEASLVWAAEGPDAAMNRFNAA